RGRGGVRMEASTSSKLGLLPAPTEVGRIRLRPLKVSNSGKPEFGWGRGGEGARLLESLLCGLSPGSHESSCMAPPYPSPPSGGGDAVALAVQGDASSSREVRIIQP